MLATVFVAVFCDAAEVLVGGPHRASNTAQKRVGDDGSDNGDPDPHRGINPALAETDGSDCDNDTALCRMIDLARDRSDSRCTILSAAAASYRICSCAMLSEVNYSSASVAPRFHSTFFVPVAAEPDWLGSCQF